MIAVKGSLTTTTTSITSTHHDPRCNSITSRVHRLEDHDALEHLSARHLVPPRAVRVSRRKRPLDDHRVRVLQRPLRRLPPQRRDALREVHLPARARVVLVRRVSEHAAALFAEQLAAAFKRLLPLAERVDDRSDALARARVGKDAELALFLARLSPLLLVRRERAFGGFLGGEAVRGEVRGRVDALCVDDDDDDGRDRIFSGLGWGRSRDAGRARPRGRWTIAVVAMRTRTRRVARSIGRARGGSPSDARVHLPTKLGTSSALAMAAATPRRAVVVARRRLPTRLDDARETRETDETRTLRAATRPSAFMRQVASAEGDESRARGGRRLVVRADAEWDDESEQKLRHVTARGRDR